MIKHGQCRTDSMISQAQWCGSTACILLWPSHSCDPSRHLICLCYCWTSSFLFFWSHVVLFLFDFVQREVCVFVQKILRMPLLPLLRRCPCLKSYICSFINIFRVRKVIEGLLGLLHSGYVEYFSVLFCHLYIDLMFIISYYILILISVIKKKNLFTP